MKFLFSLLVLTFSALVFSCSEDGKTGFIPENELYIPAHSKLLNESLTKDNFDAVIDKLETMYAPVIASMGGKLTMIRNWDHGKVNASASRLGKNWMVDIYGGLARHPQITPDSFALVICHELGHLIGGAPKVSDPFRSAALSWATNEGQADYFATLKCLRQVFLNDDNIPTGTVPETLKKSCLASHPNKKDNEICVRSGLAALSIASFFVSFEQNRSVSLDTPDISKVGKTDDSHPAAQCRLDTFFQGAICDKSMNEEVSQQDEIQGTCHVSRGDTSGLRPSCWFRTNI